MISLELNGDRHEELFTRLFEWMPDIPRDKIVIAGGYATNPDLAGDIDVWILGALQTWEEAFPNYHEARSLRETDDVWAPRKDYTTTVNVPDDWFDYDGRRVYCSAPNESEMKSYSKEADRRLMRTFEKAWYGRNVQIMFVRATTLAELLDGFDITTHMAGLQWEGTRSHIVRGTQWTPTNLPPQVVRTDQPAKSLERLLKIAARYGTTPDPYLIQDLTERAYAKSVVDGLGDMDEWGNAA